MIKASLKWNALGKFELVKSNRNTKMNSERRLGKKRGFTLVELLIVIAIIAVLFAIAVPYAMGAIKNSKLVADQATVKTLNTTTLNYRIMTLEKDIFLDTSKTVPELMGVLVENKYLSSVVKPQTKEAEFIWIFEEEKWYLYFVDSFYVVTLSDGFTLKSGRLSGSYVGKSKDIIIPKSIDGLLLSEIYQDTFYKQGLISVDFDGNTNLKKIHARAFMGNKLTSVKFPDSLEMIDVRSFKDNMISEIVLPPNLKRIENSAFDGNDLTQIAIGSNVSDIQTLAFGKNTDKFIEAYKVGGAGTYIWDGKNWVLQP